MIARLPAGGPMPLHPAHPLPPMQRLIARHGAAAVTLALIRALIAPQPRRPRARNAADLGPHLRRDLGLPPLPRSPRYWEHL